MELVLKLLVAVRSRVCSFSFTGRPDRDRDRDREEDDDGDGDGDGGGGTKGNRQSKQAHLQHRTKASKRGHFTSDVSVVARAAAYTITDPVLEYPTLCSGKWRMEYDKIKR